MSQEKELDFDKILSKNLTRRNFLKGGTHWHLALQPLPCQLELHPC